jgi:hypothetical protein
MASSALVDLTRVTRHANHIDRAYAARPLRALSGPSLVPVRVGQAPAHGLPAFPDGPSQGPRPQRTPAALTDPILSGMSRPRYAVLRRAVRRGGVLPRRAGGAAGAMSERWPAAEMGGGSGGAKKWLVE